MVHYIIQCMSSEGMDLSRLPLQLPLQNQQCSDPCSSLQIISKISAAFIMLYLLDSHAGAFLCGFSHSIPLLRTQLGSGDRVYHRQAGRGFR